MASCVDRQIPHSNLQPDYRQPTAADESVEGNRQQQPRCGQWIPCHPCKRNACHRLQHDGGHREEIIGQYHLATHRGDDLGLFRALRPKKEESNSCSGTQ
jgi:hypothetical protein